MSYVANKFKELTHRDKVFTDLSGDKYDDWAGVLCENYGIYNGPHIKLEFDGYLSIRLHAFPEQCSVLIANRLEWIFKSQAQVEAVFEVANTVADDLGYTAVMVTVNDENEYEMMKEIGFNLLGKPFKNRRTGATIYTLRKLL